MVSPAGGMVMVYVPEGRFLMGSAPGNADADSDEFPQHEVYLDAFWIGQTEVTNGMYAQCADAGACEPPRITTNSATRSSYYGNPSYMDYPVIYVSWDQAQAYCAWAGGRLPTEAEWEKAARGAEGTRTYPWGEGISCPRANFAGCEGDTTRAGSYPAGASLYGALDMAGNVAEWTASAYAPYPDLKATLPGEFGGKPSGGQAGGRDESTSPATGPGSSPAPSAAGEREIAPNDPRLAFFGKDELQDERPRACRGGSFNSYAKFLRCADRQKDKPGARWSNLGFRCAADAGSADGAKP